MITMIGSPMSVMLKDIDLIIISRLFGGRDEFMKCISVMIVLQDNCSDN